jgi:hypothetical protein
MQEPSKQYCKNTAERAKAIFFTFLFGRSFKNAGKLERERVISRTLKEYLLASRNFKSANKKPDGLVEPLAHHTISPLDSDTKTEEIPGREHWEEHLRRQEERQFQGRGITSFPPL